MSDITVIGSINMDMVIHTPRMPALGETILGSGFMSAPGGKGANQAVAAAKLGGDVAMIGCVGEDIFGESLLYNMKTNGTKTDEVCVQKGVPTGVAVITVKDGDNSIIVDPGANAYVDRERVNQASGLVTKSRILLMQLEIPLDTVKYAVGVAKQKNVKVLLNPAPACELDNELLSGIDILTPNENECAMLSGIRIRTVEDAKAAVRILMQRGVRQVIVTLGEKGAVYNWGDTIVHKAVPKIKAVDTTAAGDSFCGALAVALAAGRPIDAAVDFACIVGMLTVQRPGAQCSLPSLSEVRQYNKRIQYSAGQF